MSYVAMLLLLNLLILVHEAGHLVAARAVGMPVAAFSVGLGPRIWTWRWRSTDYSLRLLPLGGFVLPGFADDASFRAVALRKRIAYFLGGPLANLVVCLPLLAALDTAARGWSFQAVLVEPVRQLAETAWQTLAALSGAVSHPELASGVVGIVLQGGRLLAGGLASEVAISLSVSLAVLNLLPIPVLDGGQILLSCVEEIWPRAAQLRVPLTLVGLVVLAGVLLYVNGQDVARYWG